MAFEVSKFEEVVDLSGGEWIDEIPDHPGLRLKVRSQNYKPYQVASNAFYRKNCKATESDIGFMAAIAASGKHIAAHLLIDWDMSKATGPFALVDKGKPVKYSTELALAVLTADDAHGAGAEYRGAVLWAASKVAEKLASEAEVLSGN